MVNVAHGNGKIISRLFTDSFVPLVIEAIRVADVAGFHVLICSTDHTWEAADKPEMLCAAHGFRLEVGE